MTSPTAPNAPHKCGSFILSDDKTHWTCEKCGKVSPMLVTLVEEETKMTPRHTAGRR